MMAKAQQNRYVRRIVEIRPLSNTRAGNWLTLECGHRVMAFGDLAHCEGWVLCLECLKREEPNESAPA